MDAKKEEMLNKIKLNLPVLERENPEEFDLITALFNILHQTNDLLGTVCNRERINEWKEQEDPSFYRFASLLKKGLMQQNSYLDTILNQLTMENDAIAQKIAMAKEQLSLLLEHEQALFNEAEAIFEQQVELRQKKAQVDALQSRKDELADLKKKYSRINIKKLQIDIEQKETLLAELTNKCAPLLKKQEELQNATTELIVAERNLDSELGRLENVYCEKSREITEKLPDWIEKIKKRRVERKQKADAYELELVKELAELDETEKVIKQRLEELNRIYSLAADNRDVCTIHFAANRKISGNFSASFSEVESKLSDLLAAVDRKLEDFDVLLKNAQQKHQEIAAACKPIGIGG
jgi:DNA repair exonuclease SbcCD ATPase subunit